MGQLIQGLMKTELLKDVSDDILQQVSAHAHPIDLEADELLLSPEQDNHHIYLLLWGTLSVHFHSPDSPVMRELTAGYSVGEMSIIDGSRPSAYVKAKEDCQVFPIHRDFLLYLIQTTNPIAYNLLRLMTEWMKSNTQKIIKDQFQISELSNQANIDVLTGLYNRRWLDQALPRMLSQTKSMTQPLCVLILDIDHFKNYNDLHGHLGGDVALVAMGNVLKSNLRLTIMRHGSGVRNLWCYCPIPNTAMGLSLQKGYVWKLNNKRFYILTVALCQALPCQLA